MTSTIPDMEKQPLLQPPSISGDPRSTTATASSTETEQSLSDLQQNVFKAQREYMRAWSRSTSGKWHQRIMLSVTALLLLFMLFCIGIIVQDSFDDDSPRGPRRGGGYIRGGKVPLEAHIMSKCPDARDCLHDMILPAMQEISDSVDFRLSYIGNITDHDDGVLCLHGEQECLGNILELCTAHLYPDPKIYLGFTMCLSRSYTEIPSRELVEDCALEHGISIEKLNRCAVSDDVSEGAVVGLELLKESFQRSAEVGVKKSCTVRLDGQVRCIRDGGKWYDCEGGSEAKDLVRDVRHLVREARRWRQGWVA